MGSAGVTVIGIALMGIRDGGRDFIDVYLNGDPISLFNSFKHTVGDVLVGGSISPSMLISRTGKNLKYRVNGKNKIAFGERGENAVIKVNNEIASIDTVIKENDKINIQFAVDGKNPKVTLISLLDEFNSKSFSVDGNIMNTEPIAIINKTICENIFEYEVKDGDNIEIIYPVNIADIKKYIIKSESTLFKDNEELDEEYKISEGEAFSTIIEKEIFEIEEINYNQEELNVNEVKTDIEVQTQEELINKVEQATVIDSELISIIVNGKDVKLPNDNSTLFFQVFNYIDINLDGVKSLVSLTLNGEKANYTDPLKDGDIIEIVW